MTFKALASIALAAASLAGFQASAADMSNVEASRGEHLRHTHQSVVAAPAATTVAANDFLQEAERGEYLRSVGSSQGHQAARHLAASDAMSPAEATRGSL